eukprot:1189604-Prorocentrum_minimum.AAC.3
MNSKYAENCLLIGRTSTPAGTHFSTVKNWNFNAKELKSLRAASSLTDDAVLRYATVRVQVAARPPPTETGPHLSLRFRLLKAVSPIDCIAFVKR